MPRCRRLSNPPGSALGLGASPQRRAGPPGVVAGAGSLPGLSPGGRGSSWVVTDASWGGPSRLGWPSYHMIVNTTEALQRESRSARLDPRGAWLVPRATRHGDPVSARIGQVDRAIAESRELAAPAPSRPPRGSPAARLGRGEDLAWATRVGPYGDRDSARSAREDPPPAGLLFCPRSSGEAIGQQRLSRGSRCKAARLPLPSIGR